MDSRAELFALIDRVLAGQVTPDEFENAFYSLYFDETPDSALTEREREFVGDVCEKLDFTGSAPDAESRQYGWVDYSEFVDWLREAYASFRAETGPATNRDRAT